MRKVENRQILVKFVASTSSDLQWNFEPSQSEITVAPGETALAFFKAKNNTNRPIIGIGSIFFCYFQLQFKLFFC
jgi:cytochrome c oxidase assembly protein subunit 11